MFHRVLNHVLNKGHLPRRLKLLLLKLRSLLRIRRVGVATFAVVKVTLLLHALTVPHPTLSYLMMFILLGRIELAMCLPSMWELKVVARKAPFGFPSLL